ncbi:hypothetical protein CARUB_v10006614mg [Capsella rubella]|uniref:RING-type E3 ubiquitin transferase n=1 Tax=Capsella rubella TaxID=81985 RepID=R0H3N9_9BRAS|nr:putative E3 ubiquitin-protein ligase SINA-like 6 [Capsella rubella]EOA18148.1 hypothetical protein CARUB_v10006614mg [Capsella rubella]
MATQKKQRTDDKTRPAMLDYDVLDCPVCFEPPTIPILQCGNGHWACSSCLPKLKKCHSCSLTIGRIRCRAMESVLESILIPCPNAMFGCTKNLSYGKQSTHVKDCIFSQCSCPFQECNYSGSYKNLYDHSFQSHSSSYPFPWIPHIACDISFRVLLKISNKILVAKEFLKKLLFVVQCFKEPNVLRVTVSCLAPSAPEVGRFSYHLSYTVDGETVTYESPEVKRILKVSSQRPEESFMLIPECLLRGDYLDMKLCIKKLKQI